MFIYIIFLVFIAYCAYRYDIKGDKVNKKKAQWGLVVMLILLAGLRNKIGSDSIGYEYNFDMYSDIFTMIKDRSLLESSQPMWIFFNGIVKTIFGDFIFFQIIHASIVNVLIYNFIRKVTPYFFSTYFFFFIVSWWDLNFEILRESLCVAMFLNGLLLLMEKKWKPYIVIAIIAGLTHHFGIVMFLLAPALFYTPKKILYVVSPILIVYLLFFLDQEKIMLLVLALGDYIGESAFDHASSYMSDGESFTTQNFNGMVQIFLCGVISPIVLILKNDKTERNFYFNRILLVYLVIYILQGQLVILHRFLNYMYLIPIICTMEFVLNYKGSINVNKGLALLSMLMLFYVKFSDFRRPPRSQPQWSQDYRYIPYKSVFQEPNAQTLNAFPFGTCGIIK